MFRVIPSGHVKVSGLGFLGSITSELSNLQRRGGGEWWFLLSFEGFKLIPFFSCLFACRMVRGHEEASTSQVGRKRGNPWKRPW